MGFEFHVRWVASMQSAIHSRMSIDDVITPAQNGVAAGAWMRDFPSALVSAIEVVLQKYDHGAWVGSRTRGCREWDSFRGSSLTSEIQSGTLFKRGASAMTSHIVGGWGRNYSVVARH